MSEITFIWRICCVLQERLGLPPTITATIFRGYHRHCPTIKQRKLTFNAIDVETANSDRASICQIGIVQVQDGEIVDRWQTLVDPEAWFDPTNVSIHGIEKQSVAGAPTMPAIRAELRQRLRGSILVSHTSFDRVAFERAMDRYGLEQLQVTWLDSAQIVRRTWERYYKQGYGLKNVASDFGIKYNHHDALEDAYATAEIVLRACAEKQWGIDEWVLTFQQPRRRTRVAAPQRVDQLQPNVEGHLYGEAIVFTGELSIPRRAAAELAAQAGCQILGTVSRKCTLLVVGASKEAKRFRLRRYKSAKHKRAEHLLKAGQDLQIISERDFHDLMKIS